MTSAARLRPPLAAALLVAASFGAGSAIGLEAQVGTETQLAIAPDLDVEEIDRALRDRLGLFPEAEGFRTARLFRLADGRFLLEIESIRGGARVRERSLISPDELEALRTRIARALAERPGLGTTEGRTGIILANTLLGLSYYGLAMPEVLDTDDDSRAQLGTYLVTAGASFALPWLLTRNRTITDAHRDLSVWGGTRGILYGITLAEIFDDEDEPSTDNPEEDDDLYHALGIGTSVAGSFLGFKAVDWTSATQEEVDLWATLGDFGLAYGFGTALALGLYDTSEEECHGDLCDVDEIGGTDRGHAAALAIGLGSLVAAARWAPADRYTTGDARALRAFGVLGAQAVLPIAHAVWDGDAGGAEPFFGSLVLGSVGGLYLGDRLLEHQSLTGGAGWLVLAGHLAGGLGALGVTYLLDGGSTADETVYLTTSALGSAAGSIFTLLAVAHDGQAASGAAGRPIDSAQLEIGGFGALAAALVTGQDGPRRTIPLLTWRF